MSRFRNKRTPKEVPFLADNLNGLEDRMIALVKKPALSTNEVMEWLFPKSTLDVLRAAKPVARESGTLFDTNIVSLPFGEVALRINLVKSDIFIPRDGTEQLQDHKGEHIVSYLEQVHAVCMEWNKVRCVVTWINDHIVTPSAARHYWPTILSLVNESHPVYGVDGERFKDVEGISAIIPLMRETAGIVATALLMPKVEPKPLSYTDSSFTFKGHDRSFVFCER